MLETITHRIAEWWQRRIAAHQLEALDDRLLADLGTSREDIARFVAAIDHC